MKPLIAMLLACLAQAASAGTIDFEQIPGAIAVEALPITNQFQAYYGITFRTPNGDPPVLVRVGWPQAGFDRNGTVNPSDTVRDNQTNLIDQFFVSYNNTGTDTIILDFRSPVSQVSGYVLDVDSGEDVTISAFADRTSTNALASLLINGASPNTGDGIATFWSLVRGSKDIERIELLVRGRMGHDLLSSDYVPPPAPPATLGIRTYPGITIRGAVGRPYRIDYADKLDRTPTTTNWHMLTNIFLPHSPYLFLDATATNSLERYYRAVNIP